MYGETRRVQFLSDDWMPDGHNWVLCRSNGQAVLYLRESARHLSAEAAADVLTEAWEGYCEMVANEIPEQRSGDLLDA